jgi:hypothetical protein
MNQWASHHFPVTKLKLYSHLSGMPKKSPRKQISGSHASHYRGAHSQNTCRYMGMLKEASVAYPSFILPTSEEVERLIMG